MKPYRIKKTQKTQNTVLLWGDDRSQAIIPKPKLPLKYISKVHKPI